jgi:type IV fimbrial biogenesis protein FimT
MRRPPSYGFTLIELMIVLAVLAVLVTTAAPGFREFIAGQRVKAAAFDLASELMLARSEAIKRNDALNPVTLTPASGGWKNGWALTAGAIVLSSHGAFGNALSFDGAPNSIVFDGNGRKSDPGEDVRITIGSSATNSERCVELDLSGRARSRLGACT